MFSSQSNREWKDADWKIAQGAIVIKDGGSVSGMSRGCITVGRGTIIGPSVRIHADAGPVLIGEDCLIDECVVIRHM